MKGSKTQRVVILGASDKAERTSNQAVKQLLEHGHDVVPVHPGLSTVEGLPVVSALGAVTGPVDVVTVYVSPAISAGLVGDLEGLRPGRVLFNPGAENLGVAEKLQEAGITTQDVCTLVLLASGQF